MKKILLSFFVLISVAVSAQNDVTVPEGVVYKKKTAQVNDKARTLLYMELNAATATYGLFDGQVVIGPRLWKRYKAIEAIGKIKGGNIEFHIPTKSAVTQKDTLETYSGKLIQNLSDYKTVWKQIQADASKQSPVVRKVTAKELSYYWAIINFDIEEPLFVVETGTFNLLVQFIEKKMSFFWLEELPK
jgi:hypothetical protein